MDQRRKEGRVNSERFYGAFIRRSVTLPQGVISASFEDGMLQVTVRGSATTAELQHIPSEVKQG